MLVVLATLGAALQPAVERRAWLGAAAVAVVARDEVAVAKCTDIESCREEGERRIEEEERMKGPTVSLPGGVRYREMELGDGPALAVGDSADIRFQVLQSANGYFMYGVPDRMGKDLSETYRVTLGSLDVPEGVEDAMVGAARGSRRRVQLPPNKGFATSEWRPEPADFAGKQRIKRFQALLTGSGSQPGYDAQILFEFEVVRVKKRSKST
ncbi:hypothetical protein CTAYLR_006001 [Chrysophaeum taylorii]|uniref:peptidylprolyl isomerase n=1 Tax=Chrysophaeum taylorii TaxID=2483200 RepID=A0AAD7U4Q1_9STRA|nr:hypothetical protein CTAYLR_006001 [Chrysophaeum taylorii]